MTSSSSRTLFRSAFAVYTLALLTATHWPGLAIEGPIDRTDLVIHASVFAIWAAFLRFSVSLKLSTALIMGLLFALLDETTQPWFNRVFDWWDLGADAAGVTLGSLIISICRTSTAQSCAKPL